MTTEKLNDSKRPAREIPETFCNATLVMKGSLLPYVCTSRPGHEGKHVARLGGFGEVVAIWEEWVVREWPEGAD